MVGRRSALDPAGPAVKVFRLPADPTEDNHGNVSTARTLHHVVNTFAVAPPLNTSVNKAEPAEAGRDVVLIPRTIYAHPGTDALAADEVEIGDDTTRYRIIGRPGVWTDPWTGEQVGVVIEVEAVNG